VRDRRAAAADHGGSCRGRHRPWLAHADLVSRVGLPASGRGPDRHRVGLCDQDLAAASRGHRSRQVHRYRCHAGQPTDGRARCGGRWPAHLTLGGILGDYPPIDPAGFDAFVASLPFPDIAEAIERAEPLDDPVGFRFPASVRHRYERLREFPDGLLVIGDAVSSFNPGYGQGMTVAANQAMALRRLLARDTNPSPRQYFRLIAKTVDPPWDIAAGADLAFPDVPDTRTLKIQLVNAYIPRLHAAAAHDAALSAAFGRVLGLIDRPEGLLRPDRVTRVWWTNRRHPAPPRSPLHPTRACHDEHQKDQQAA
jgi:hypothetical protein